MRKGLGTFRDGLSAGFCLLGRYTLNSVMLAANPSALCLRQWKFIFLLLLRPFTKAPSALALSPPANVLQSTSSACHKRDSRPQLAAAISS